VKGIDAGALRMLEDYRWPGNVRELRNAVERAMLLSEGEWLTALDFGNLSATDQSCSFRLPPEGVVLEEVERQLLAQALERCSGNQTRAGALLGINRDQVRYRLDKFGLSRFGADRAAVATSREPVAASV
jgi:two-component system response regulator AtoC